MTHHIDNIIKYLARYVKAKYYLPTNMGNTPFLFGDQDILLVDDFEQ